MKICIRYVAFLKKVHGKKVIRRRTWNNTFDPKKMSWRWPEYQGLLGKSQHLAFFPPRTSFQSCSILISFGQALTLSQFAKICFQCRTHGNSFFLNNFDLKLNSKANIYLKHLWYKCVFLLKIRESTFSQTIPLNKQSVNAWGWFLNKTC